MNVIKINGKTIECADGVSISVNGDNVTVGNQKITIGNSEKEVKIEVNGGFIGSIKSDASITVIGNVHGDVDARNSLKCGDITGSAKAGNSIQCRDIGGNAKAGNSIKMGKKV